MNWTTLYISGKQNFEQEVADRLASSDFKYMKGSLENTGLALYWVDETAPLRAFKEAIGSKVIFKYRLRFYSSVEEFVESQNNGLTNRFTKEEQALINRMNGLDKKRRNNLRTA
jgi:hypothetical protein